MKYFVDVNGGEHEVELVEHPGALRVLYDGQPVRVRYEEVDRLGQVALHIGDGTRGGDGTGGGDRCYAVSIEGSSTEVLVTVAGHLYEVALEDERERAAHAAERSRPGGGGVVKSVMPGVVVKVLVSAGESVERDQPLLILEAMKMQNEIAAPHAGKVAAVHVREGQAVAGGAKLVSLSGEAPGPGDRP